MNRTWYMATMALTLVAGCSKNKDVVSYGNNDVDETTPEEIVLGVGQGVSVKPVLSRGMGIVGGLSENNKWNGDTVYVYGINTTTDKVAINGEAAIASENAVTSSLKWVDSEKHYYYEVQDLFDFYGVHVGGAKAEMSVIEDSFDDSKEFTVDLTLDGTQDIMVAVPDKSEDIQAAIDGEGVLKPESPEDIDKLYSAWSARRGVIPNLKFSHLLTGLKFNAKCGNNEALSSNVNIKSIVAKDVESEITLTVIPKKDEEGIQSFVPKSVPADFTLKANEDGNGDGNLDDFEGFEITGSVSDDFIAFGGGMLLVPAQEYTIEITISQTINEKEETRIFSYKFSSEDVDAGDGGVDSATGFQAGALYDINIVVYGLEEIKVNGTLIEWKNGGDVTIDPDDM